jgi:hypothetical protein
MDDRTYVAFKADDGKLQQSFQLRRASGGVEFLKYIDRHLMRLSPDRTVLTMFFYSLNIIITGRNLDRLAFAIDSEFCAWAQEYDRARWDEPPKDAPFIGKIDLYMPKHRNDERQDDERQREAAAPAA